jgi:hypothetical protein
MTTDCTKSFFTCTSTAMLNPAMLVSRLCHSLSCCLMLLVAWFSGAAEADRHTRVPLENGRWLVNGRPTNLAAPRNLLVRSTSGAAKTR